MNWIFSAIKFSPWGRVFKIIVPLIGSIALIWYIFSLGSNHGKSVIQNKWDAQKAIDAKILVAEEKKIASKEAIHRANDRKISDELVSLKESAADNVSRIRTQLIVRLQQNNERENVYRNQAEAGAVERANLASYAAQLDRSLSEGIGLVEELEATLKLRDGQIQGLAAQIKNDRQLIIESGQPDAND